MAKLPKRVQISSVAEENNINQTHNQSQGNPHSELNAAQNQTRELIWKPTTNKPSSVPTQITTMDPAKPDNMADLDFAVKSARPGMKVINNAIKALETFNLRNAAPAQVLECSSNAWSTGNNSNISKPTGGLESAAKPCSVNQTRVFRTSQDVRDLIPKLEVPQIALLPGPETYSIAESAQGEVSTKSNQNLSNRREMVNTNAELVLISPIEVKLVNQKNAVMENSQNVPVTLSKVEVIAEQVTSTKSENDPRVPPPFWLEPSYREKYRLPPVSPYCSKNNGNDVKSLVVQNAQNPIDVKEESSPLIMPVSEIKDEPLVTPVISGQTPDVSIDISENALVVAEQKSSPGISKSKIPDANVAARKIQISRFCFCFFNQKCLEQMVNNKNEPTSHMVTNPTAYSLNKKLDKKFCFPLVKGKAFSFNKRLEKIIAVILMQTNNQVWICCFCWRNSVLLFLHRILIFILVEMVLCTVLAIYWFLFALGGVVRHVVSHVSKATTPELNVYFRFRNWFRKMFMFPLTKMYWKPWWAGRSIDCLVPPWGPNIPYCGEFVDYDPQTKRFWVKYEVTDTDGTQHHEEVLLSPNCSVFGLIILFLV